MPINSKRKGVRGEREAAALLRGLGYPECKRSAQVAAIRPLAFSADLFQCIRNVRIEVKFGYGFDLHTKAVKDWIAKIKEETPQGEVWLILYKRMRKPWIAIYEDQGVDVAALNVVRGIYRVDILANEIITAEFSSVHTHTHITSTLS